MAWPDPIPLPPAAANDRAETVELISVEALARWLGQRAADIRAVVARGELGPTVRAVLDDGTAASVVARPAPAGATPEAPPPQRSIARGDLGPDIWVWRPSLPGTLTAHLLAPAAGRTGEGTARVRTRCGRDEAPRWRFEPAPVRLRRCRACRQHLDAETGGER